MTEENETIHTLQESSNNEDKTIVVGNLPPNCEEDFIWNYFENRRQFGDGIEVTQVEIANEEALVTFKNQSDVETVLQRHARTPCRLGQSELTIKSRCSSDTDEDSIVVLDYPSCDTPGLQPFSLQRQDSTMSVWSINSTTNFDGADLMGSGSCISKQISDLKLVLCPPSRDKVEHTMGLNERELNPVTVSYVATTTAYGLPDSRVNNSSITSKQTTLLQHKLETQFGRSVTYELDNKILVLTICEEIEGIDTIDDFEKAVLALLRSFESEIKVMSLNLNTEEKLNLAVKHFESFVHQRPQIKMYRTDHDLSLFIVMPTEDDKRLVAVHADILRQQGVEERVKALSGNDGFKIEACKQMIDRQKAHVLVQNGKVYIRGFLEDIYSTLTVINQVLQRYICESKELDDFVVELMKDTSIYKEIAQELTKARLKVWFRVCGNSVYVVGDNKNHVKAATERIHDYFDETEIKLEEYMFDSKPWDIQKQRVMLEHPGSWYMDDIAKRPFVVIKSTATVCRKVSAMLEDFKLRYTRIEKMVKLTEANCCFVLQHLTKEIEKTYEEEFLKVKQDADKVTLIIEGTEKGVGEVMKKIKEVKTIKCWIVDENFADWLKQMSQQSDPKWNKIVHVHENPTQIMYETGKIETRKVDAIVNSTSEYLNLNVGIGTVTQSIFSEAGLGAQKCLEGLHQPLAFGSVVPGDPGNLKCKKIFHAVLGAYSAVDENTCKATLGKVVKECLCIASAGGYASIAFPALCTGVHKYPVRVVAKTMLDSIIDFINQNEKTSLKQIIIVFLNEDKEKRKIFEEHEKQRQEELNNLKKKIVLETTPWPCRYYCYITAATTEDAFDFTEEIKAKLSKQTLGKK